MKNLKTFEIDVRSMSLLKGGTLPAGWTKTTLPNGDVRYDGPNGSYIIVHNSQK